MNEELKRIEAVLNEKVRPSLRAHGGGLEIDHLEDGVLYIKLLGQCAGCPSADLTNETVIEAEVVKALPDLVERVVGSRPSAMSCGSRPSGSCGTTICKRKHGIQTDWRLRFRRRRQSADRPGNSGKREGRVCTAAPAGAFRSATAA